MWQDFVLGIVGYIFLSALLPQVVVGFRVKKRLVTKPTALMTGIGMWVISFVHFSLGLIFTGVSEFLLGAMWFVLYYQAIKYKEVRKEW